MRRRNVLPHRVNQHPQGGERRGRSAQHSVMSSVAVTVVVMVLRGAVLIHNLRCRRTYSRIRCCEK